MYICLTVHVSAVSFLQAEFLHFAENSLRNITEKLNVIYHCIDND